jgi:hypothetical protein
MILFDGRTFYEQTKMQILILVAVGIVCLLGWAISSIREALQLAKDRKARDAIKKSRVQKIKQKWGNRKIDIDKTLEARNEDIIKEHLGRLKTGYHRPIEDSVRDCIQDIAEAEGDLTVL